MGFERGAGGVVASRNRDERRRAGLDERTNERALGGRVARHVEQHHPLTGDERAAFVNFHGRNAEQLRAIGSGRRGELRLEVFQERSEVGAHSRGRDEDVSRHKRAADFAKGCGEGARESRKRRDRREVFERVGLRGLECGTRGDRFRPERARRAGAPQGERHRGNPRGQLREAESMNAGGGAALERKRPGQVVCRAARGRHHEHLASGWHVVQESCRLAKACCSRRRCDHPDRGRMGPVRHTGKLASHRSRSSDDRIG
jgi:hypothetical protein